jgi:hypothetical protein
MEDVIYIVLGLLWLIFTFYIQSKKKKQREAQQSNAPPQSPQSPKSFFDQLFVEQTPVPEPVDEEITEPEVVKAEAPKTQRRRSTFEEEYEKLGIKSLEDTQLRFQGSQGVDSGKNNLEKKHEFDPGKQGEVEAEEGLEFDLKKAVIMAEILKRPYT